MSVNSKLKRSLAEQVRTRFTKLVSSQHYVRTRTAFWVRVQAQTVEFCHLHLFSFEQSFRLHLGIRVLNESFDAPHLNGPTTDGHRRYDTAFAESPDALDRCAGELHRFCLEVGEPWFAQWRDPRSLLESVRSPLTSEATEALRSALAGHVNADAVRLSSQLLGLNKLRP